ncbi:MAG: T9SS type A sorting domain-containing protein [Flavobacteriales bacterium]|nr:T9SS type A sorting domain-containing protein [Flavobacteriales bacterium]
MNPRIPVLFLMVIASLRTLGVQVSISTHAPTCDQNNGRLYAYATGGITPYTYSWSSGQTSANITGLAPGPYSVTVTDALGNTASANATLTMSYTTLGGVAVVNSIYDCNGWCAGYVDIDISSLEGQGPYSFNPPPSFTNGSVLHFGSLCGGQLELDIVDANGCSGHFSYFAGEANGADLYLQYANPACAGQNNGSFQIEVWQDMGSFGHCVSVYPVAGGSPVYENGPVPSGTYLTVDNLAPGQYTVSVITCDGMGAQYCPGPSIEVEILDLGPLCGGVQGLVFHDADQNCSQGSGDIPLPYQVLTILPGPEYAITDANGHFLRNLDYGAYTVEQSDPELVQLCPPAGAIPFSLNAGAQVATIDLADSSIVPHDLDVHLWSTSARPGFYTQVTAVVRNNSAYPSGSVDLSLSFDALLTNPAPANGLWTIGIVQPYAEAVRTFSALVPANINLLGTVMNYTATVTNSASETNTSNNTTTLAVTITGSYDPNDKQGIASSGTSPWQYFLDQDEWIDYTIRFQNTGTAAAESVVIRDTLDADLNIASLEILGASHAFTPVFDDGREIAFTFSNINLPDSSTDLLGSQGFVSYRIKPNDGLLVGNLLENTANIYFDFNPAIVTNTTSHWVDFSTSLPEQPLEQVLVLPNPTSDLLNVILPKGPNSVEVISIDGRRIQVPATRRDNGFQLDVRSLQPGTYLLRTGNSVARFVKQ